MKAHFPTSPSDIVKEENIEERTVHLDIAEQGLTENMDERIYARHHIKAKKESSYPRNPCNSDFIISMKVFNAV